MKEQFLTKQQKIRKFYMIHVTHIKYTNVFIIEPVSLHINGQIGAM